jgi:hypothetical protein
LLAVVAVAAWISISSIAVGRMVVLSVPGARVAGVMIGAASLIAAVPAALKGRPRKYRRAANRSCRRRLCRRRLRRDERQAGDPAQRLQSTAAEAK